MSVLGVWGEDIDFQAGRTPAVSTTAGTFRAAYARCALDIPNTSGNPVLGPVLAGGAITSGWFTFQFAWYGNGAATTSQKVGGMIASSGGTAGKGLYIGTGASTATKVTLYKWDGTTLTSLATETGTSWLIAGVAGNGTQGLQRFDVQIINFGVSATVNVYLAGNLIITFTGDVTVSGVTSVDSMAFGPTLPTGAGGSTGNTMISEVCVSGDPTLNYTGIFTLALTGAGGTNSWTNSTFSNINSTTFSDTNPTNSNTNAQLNEYNITDLSGSFAIIAVKRSIRAALGATHSVTGIEMGWNHNSGTPAYGTGASKLPGAAYGLLEQLDLVDPVTGVTWAQADINTLQTTDQSLT